jgi:hypothetical protein
MVLTRNDVTTIKMTNLTKQLQTTISDIKETQSNT